MLPGLESISWLEADSKYSPTLLLNGHPQEMDSGGLKEVVCLIEVKTTQKHSLRLWSIAVV